MCFHTPAAPLLPTHDLLSRSKVRYSLASLGLPSELVELILDCGELYTQLRSEVHDGAMSSSTETLLAPNLNLPMFSKWCWCAELPYGRRYLGTPKGGWQPVAQNYFELTESSKGWAWAFAVLLDMEVLTSAATEGRVILKTPPENDDITLTMHVNAKFKVQVADVSDWEGRARKVWWFRRDDGLLDAKARALLRTAGWWENATLKVGGTGMRCPKRVTIFRAELAVYIH